MLRRLASRVLRAICLSLVDLIPLEDPWTRYPKPLVPYWMFGKGSRKEFREYLASASSVQARSLPEICAWLRDCRYATDLEMFGTADLFQDPVDFEKTRAGDCDDHALWAWRKLIELQLPAEFVTGDKHFPDTGWCGHAWVHVLTDSEMRVLDAVVKDATRMLVPLGEAREYLRPHFAVDKDMKYCVFEGYLLYLKEKRQEERIARRTKGRAA